jgi:hypothetical protein
MSVDGGVFLRPGISIPSSRSSFCTIGTRPKESPTLRVRGSLGFWSCRSKADQSLQNRNRFTARLRVLYTNRRMMPFLPRLVMDAWARLMTCEVLEIASRVSSALVIMSIVLRMADGCEREGP